MGVQYLDDAGPDGAIFGQNSSAKVGFYGKTPVARPAHIADATDAATAISQLNLVIAALETLGLKASA